MNLSITIDIVKLEKKRTVENLYSPFRALISGLAGDQMCLKLSIINSLNCYLKVGKCFGVELSS